MRRLAIFFIPLVCVACTFLLSQSIWAEEVFFLDTTEGGYFAPLVDFLENALFCSVHRIPESLRKRGELVAALAGRRAHLLLGYDWGDLICFEVWDLEEPRKVLGMVRRVEDRLLLLEGLKRQLPGILGREKEWKLLFVRHEEGKSSVVLADFTKGKEVLLPLPVEGKVETISITPEGQFFLATVSSGNVLNIFQMDFSSRIWRRLSLPEFSDAFPVFFPFHRSILFLSERKGQRGIYEMNLDGSKQRLLLERKNPIQGIAASLYAPVFAFSEFRDNRWVLILWDVLRGEERTLSFSGNVFYPVFGRQEKLFFIGEEGGVYDVYSLSLKEHSVTRLTFDGLPKAHLAVSPDGRQLAFSEEVEAGNWDIVLLEPEKGRSERFTASWARETSPVFSPIPMY